MKSVGSKGVFDRVAEAVSNEVARAWFFTACVLTVLLWVPTLWLLPLDTSQLIINTLTTIITFLMVALLQNSARRDGIALHAKHDAMATGLRDLMDHVAHVLPCHVPGCNFCADIVDLEEAVGIEDKVGTGKPKEEDDAGSTD